MRIWLPGLGVLAMSIVAFSIGPASAQDGQGAGLRPAAPRVAPLLPPSLVVRFSTLDIDGTPVPCELTLAKVQGVLATTAPTDANRARFEELKTRGIERCAAHDDARANALLAEALGMVGR